MKRFIISSIILVLIVVASFSLPSYLKSTTFELINSIDDISSDISNNNISSAISKTDSFVKLWDEQKDTITLFVNNKNVDSVTYSTHRLLPLLNHTDKSAFSSELGYIKSIIESIYEDELPCFNNIF